MLVERGKEKHRRRIDGIGSLRTCSTTGLVYRTSVNTLEAVDPGAGEPVAHKRKFMISLPDADDGILYGLDQKAIVFAEKYDFLKPSTSRASHQSHTQAP